MVTSKELKQQRNIDRVEMQVETKPVDKRKHKRAVKNR